MNAHLLVAFIGDQLPPSSLKAVATRCGSRWSMPCQENTWALDCSTIRPLKCKGTFDGDKLCIPR